MFGTCIALTYLFAYLGLSPPWFLSFGLFALALLADYASTVVASRKGAKEANPLTNALFKRVGVEKGGLIVICLFAAIMLSRWGNMPPYQQLALASTYLIVPANNLVVIIKRR